VTPPGDHKFVVYGGYLHSQYFPLPFGAVRKTLGSPLTFFWTTLPMNFGREHAALRFLNYIIADALPKTEDSLNIIYPLNDGISPISSSLLLSNDFVRSCPLRDENDLNKITANSNAKKARLFDNVDHLTFIEDRRPIGSAQDVADVLSLAEKPRPMFEWILKDLMD
jgi:hypothetical protein